MDILLYFARPEAELETKIKLFSSKLSYSHSFTEDLRDFTNLSFHKPTQNFKAKSAKLDGTMEASSHRNNAKSPMR